MIKTYSLSQQAKEDLQAIYEYGYRRWGEEQADFYFHKLFDAFLKIADQPETYQKVEFIRAGYRRCICGVDSIYFRCNSGQVEIMSIIGSQDTHGI